MAQNFTKYIQMWNFHDIHQMCKMSMTFFIPKIIWIFKIQKIPEIISLQNVLCCVKALACSQKSVVQVHWHCPTSQFWHWNVNHLSLYRQLSRFYQWKGRDLSGLFFLTARILMIQIMQLTFFTAFYKKLCVYCKLKVFSWKSCHYTDINIRIGLKSNTYNAKKNY